MKEEFEESICDTCTAGMCEICSERYTSYNYQLKKEDESDYYFYNLKNYYMIQLTTDLANEIGALALNFTIKEDFSEYYKSENYPSTIYRDFIYNDLLCSLFFTQIDKYDQKEKGIHLNIFKNGDVFARNFPYYDGELELIFVYNQRKIFELVGSL